MIKIVSGFSGQGGSSESWVNLTKALNKIGYETVFYGPHDYHLSRLSDKLGKKINDLKVNSEDSMIIHFKQNITKRFNVKNQIFSSHEQNIFPIKDNVTLEAFDLIHYVSEHQRMYHGIEHPYKIIPNIIDPELKLSQTKPKNIAGIIGSVDRNKQVHVSIKKALEDGMEKILIYGNITDPLYYQSKVIQLIDNKRVVYVGSESNKQKMYDSISRVYHNPLMESWGYIPFECNITGTEYFGNDTINVNNLEVLTEEQIVKKWVDVLSI